MPSLDLAPRSIQGRHVLTYRMTDQPAEATNYTQLATMFSVTSPGLFENILSDR